MDVLATVLRVGLSLAVVSGLLWVSYRFASRGSARTRVGRRSEITVVARQGLTQKSAAVLLDSGDKRYLLGVTDGSVTLLDTLERPAGPTPEPGTLPAVRGVARDPLERLGLQTALRTVLAQRVPVLGRLSAVGTSAASGADSPSAGAPASAASAVGAPAAGVPAARASAPASAPTSAAAGFAAAQRAVAQESSPTTEGAAA